MGATASGTVYCSGISVEYKKLDLIGRGGFGSVYKALRKSGGNEIPDQHFAVKEIRLNNEQMERLQGDLNGQEILQRWNSLLDLHHPNVLRYYQIKIERTPDGATVAFAMEFMPDGDLNRLISQLRNKEMILSPNVLLHMIEQLTFGVDYLHKSKIIHGDLKPANVLLKPCPRRHWVLIIADLDDRIELEESVTRSSDISEMRGTHKYMSPEMVSWFVKEGRERPGRKTDVWSLGCIIFDLADSLYGNGKRLFWKKRRFFNDAFKLISDDTPGRTFVTKIIAKGYVPLVSGKIPSDVADIVRSCLVAKATERTSADLLLAKVRSLLLRAVSIKSSFFRDVHVVKDDVLQDQGSDAWRLDFVWTWAPNSATIAVVEDHGIFIKNLDLMTEQRMAIPAVQRKCVFGKKPYKRRSCFLFSINGTGDFVCVGFYIGDSPVSVLEMWKHQSKKFRLIESIMTKSPIVPGSSQWNADGTCFAAVSQEEPITYFYTWTSSNMRFREATNNSPTRVFSRNFSIGGFLERTHNLDVELTSPLVRNNTDISSNSATAVTRLLFIEKADLVVELAVDNTRKQASVFRVRNGEGGQVQSEASLDWAYETLDHCTGNDYSCSDQLSIVAFCLRLPETQVAGPLARFHLWMWHERKKVPVLLSVNLAGRSLLSISPDNRKIAAFVKMVASLDAVCELAIWDTESEGILWIIKTPYYELDNPKWSSTSSCIAFSTWFKMLEKHSCEKRILALDLSKYEHGPASDEVV